MAIRIPAADVGAVYRRYREEFDDAVHRVLEGGHYILGEEVAAFEGEFAAALGASYAVALASGTDAVDLALRAVGVRPGDLIATVSHTAVATVAAIGRSGAVPVLVDIDPARYTMAPDALAEALERSPAPVAVVPVHLYGHPADMDRIRDLSASVGALVVEDAAQAYGASVGGRTVGTLGAAGAFSFYPTKNLGAFGDAGAVATDDAGVDTRLREIRQYGWRQRYVSEVDGVNSRMDELQAAILRVRLRHLAAETAHRRALAARYDEALASHSDIVAPPGAGGPGGTAPVYHQYVVAVPRGTRDAVQSRLRDQGIGTAVHYPVPVHLQPAYEHLASPGRLPATEEACLRVLSLPMGIHLTEDDATEVATSLCRAVDAARNP